MPLYFCLAPPGVSAPRPFAPFLEVGCVALGPVVALEPPWWGSGLRNSGGDSEVSKRVGPGPGSQSIWKARCAGVGASRWRQHGAPGRRWRPPIPRMGFPENSRSPLGSIHRGASPAPWPGLTLVIWGHTRGREEGVHFLRGCGKGSGTAEGHPPPEAGGRRAAGASALAPVARATSSASCAAGRCCHLASTAPCTATCARRPRPCGRRSARRAGTRPAGRSGRCPSGRR